MIFNEIVLYSIGVGYYRNRKGCAVARPNYGLTLVM